MVYSSNVYTRFGDAGQTMLASGDIVPKSSSRVRACGEVDELNASIGLIRVELRRDPEASYSLREPLDAELTRVQQELFNLGAELATAAGAARIESRHVEALERSIDQHNASLEPLRGFILPGGGPTGAAAHLARSVCRRAERQVVELSAESPVRSDVLCYLNRLGDWLFVIARMVAKRLGYDEVPWDPQNI